MKHLLRLFLWSVLCSFVLLMLRGLLLSSVTNQTQPGTIYFYSDMLPSIIGFCVFYGLTILFLRKNKYNKRPLDIAGAIALGSIILVLPLYIYNFVDTYGQILRGLIWAIAPYFAWMVYSMKTRLYKYMMTIISFGVCALLSIVIYPVWGDIVKSVFRLYGKG